jgi:hypothetical protein
MDDRTPSDEGATFPLEGRWRTALDSASTERELMTVARDFVAHVPESDLAALPASWRPGRLRSARDVSLITFRLAQGYCRPKLDSRCERSMRSLLPFFQTLSSRLFAVRSRTARA